jgi:DNA-binding NtrC family response regulator
LVVASDADWRNRLEKTIQQHVEKIIQADSTSHAIQIVSEQELTVIVTELNLDIERAGFDILKAVREIGRERGLYPQVILLAPQGQPGISAEAIKKGAYDCLEYTSYSAEFIKEVQAKINDALIPKRERQKGE